MPACRKKHWVLAVVIVLVLFLFPLVQTTAFAATHPEDTEANALKELGIIRGTGNGFALERAPTRLEAGVVLVRLLGKEETALSEKRPHPFKDVPVWADPYIGYLYSAGLTKGTSATTYGTYTVTADQMMTLLLRVLGYQDTGPSPDFLWNTAMRDAVQFSVITPACYDVITKFQNDYTRMDMVSCVFEALQAKYTGSERTLIKKLMEDGVCTARDVSTTGITDLLHAAGLIDAPYRSARWQEQIKLTPGADEGDHGGNIAINLPLTYYNRQKVISYKFSVPPDRFYWDKDHLYAVYDYKNFPKETVLEMEAELNVYKYGLRAAQENHFPLRLTDDEKVFCTENTRYIDPTILRAARETKGQTPLEIAKDLCRIVSDHLLDELTIDIDSYWGFSILYTALCREMGMPARSILVQTSFDEIKTGHIATEIYIDSLGWVLVDPVSVAFGDASVEELSNGYYAYFASSFNEDSMDYIDYGAFSF